MKKFSILFAAIAAVLFSQAAYAEGENFAVKNIAVVDVKRITEESLAAKTAKEQVTKLKDKYIAQIKATEKQLQARQKELIGQKKALSQEVFNKKVGEFQNKVASERQEAAKKQKVVEAAFLKSLELIKDETLKVVADIAKQKKLDLVIPTSQLLYSRNGIDISNEVLKELNKRLTKVDVNVK